MDPLASLSLIAAVIQLVDFAHKLVSGSREIYHSASGLTAENDVLDLIAEDVAKFGDQIPAVPQTRLSDVGLRLQKLVAKSKTLSDSILKILESLRKDKTKPGKWYSFVHLLRSVRKSPELRNLVGQINNLQAQINTSILFIIR